jgi:beta-lactamase regulating signal transducer with metallopeptidase domain
MNTPLWFSNLAFWSAQVAVLVAAAAFLPRLLQIRQPRVLLAYWRAVLAISMALPFLQPWHRLPAIRIMTIAADGSGATIAPISNPAVSHWHLPSFQTIALVIGVVILAGMVARLVILVMGLLKLRQFRRASTPIPACSETAVLLEQMRRHLNVSPGFRLSADVDSPVTFGLAAPIILLPESFPTMDSRFQVAIACHELLHVRSHDWAHHLAEETIRAAFWFHPAISWIVARVRLAREQVVDLEVVRFTNARKAYLEALLEFTARRASAAAVLAPPFLVERQLAERIAFMLKEVRMSRKRLIASLIFISCCVVFAVTVAAWTFPLKSAPLVTQSAPRGGIGGGIAAGISGGVGSGVGSGISGGIGSGVGGGIKGGINGQSAAQASVNRNTIWIDTVQRGSMPLQVRGLGKIVREDSSQKLVARMTFPESIAVEIHPGQSAVVYTHGAVVKGHVLEVKGHVIRVNGSSTDATRSIDVGLDVGTLPEGAGVNLTVLATIDAGKLDNVLWIGRPVYSAANTSKPLFRIVDEGTAAERVAVKFGRASVQTIEVLGGLKVGDRVILSDMSAWQQFERIQLK